jgi:hypothetical protein
MWRQLLIIGHRQLPQRATLGDYAGNATIRNLHKREKNTLSKIDQAELMKGNRLDATANTT